MATRQMTFLRDATAQNAVAPKLSTGERKLDFLYAGKTDDIKNRGGLAGGAEYLGASLAAGVGGIGEGVYDLVVGGISALAGNKAYAKNLFETNVVGQWHKNIEDGYNPNKLMKFTGDVSTGLGQSATMLIPVAGVPLFFGGVMGQGVGSAVEQTGELGFKEVMYGITTGAIEGTLEWAVGAGGQALSKVTKGATKTLSTKIASSIAKEWAASAVWKGVAKDVVSNAMGEFMEEALSELIDPVLQRGFKINEDASTTLRQVLYAGLVGMVSGAVMGGAVAGVSTTAAYNAGKRAINNGNAETVTREARTIIDGLKIDKDSKIDDADIVQLSDAINTYERVAAKDPTSAATMIQLGEVQGYMTRIQMKAAVLAESARLAGVTGQAATSYAQYMSYNDTQGSKSKKSYTAEDWYSNKDDIRTRYAAMGWAGAFLGDTAAMRESVSFDEAIRADREGRAAGTAVVSDIADAAWSGESGTYYMGIDPDAGPAPDGDYLRVIKLGEDNYSIARGNDSQTARGYRGLTREQAQAEFRRIQGAVATNRQNVAQRQNLEAQARAAQAAAAVVQENAQDLQDVTPAQSGEMAQNPYDQAAMNAARRAVKNFDLLTADVKTRILRWVQSTNGKSIDADVVSGVANIIRLRPDLQVMLGETKEGVSGFHTPGVAGRNLIVLSEGKDVSLLRETIAHELGHEVEGEAGYKEIKEAALAATKQTDINEWRELYKGYDDVDAEIAAKALGRRLATPKFVERFANRSIIRRAIDFGKMLLDALRADDAGRLEIAETEKLIDMMNRALQGANVQVRGENAGKKQHALQSKKDPTKLDPRTVTRDDVLEMLKNAENGIYDDNTYIPIRISTPAIVIQRAKEKLNKVIPNYPLIMSAGKAVNAMERQGYGDDGLPNRLAPEEIVNIIEAMSNPLYVVYEQETQEHPEPRYVEVVKFDLENGRKAFAVLELTGENKDAVYINGYEGGQYNVFVTVYPPKDYKLKELLTNKNNVVIYDKKKDFSQRTSGITVPSVLNDSSFFTNSIPQTGEKSTPSRKKSYNLTPEAAAQAARDAAEVEQFRNEQDAENARARQAELEFDISSKAERAIFETEITRAEVSAKDNNSRWFPWADVKREVGEMVRGYGLSGDTARYAAYVVHRAFNGFRASEGAASYTERRTNMIGSLVDYIIDAADGGNTAGRWRDERRAEIERKLNDAYNSLGKETQRQKARERVEDADERARAAINGTAVATLLDRVRLRRFRTKTAGIINQQAFENLVSLARAIRPKYQVNLPNAEAFLTEFAAFARAYAKEAMNYAENPASEDYRRIFNDAKGANPILNYVDRRLCSLLLEFEQREGGEWSDGDYETLKVALERLLAMDSRFDKQYNSDGTFGETADVADKVMSSLHKKYGGKVSDVNKGGAASFFQTLVYNSLEPEAAVRLMENAAGQHILSRMINTIKFAAEAAKSDERKWLKEIEDFKTKNKKWWKEWNEGDVVFEYTLPTMGGKTKTASIVLTKDEAASFWMTSKRHQAKAALALGRVEIADALSRKGEQYRSRIIDGLTESQIDELLSMGRVAREDFILKCENAMGIAMRAMYKNFSAEDRQYISLIENFYATTSKKEKRDMDTRLYGSTNVFDGYYYPISRSSMNRDMDLSSSYHDLDDVSTRGYAFNKSTIQGAKSRLTIRGATDVTNRHARQLAMYKHLTMPLQNLQRLYNYKADKSTAGTQSVRDYISKYAWGGFEKYLSDYYMDVQGMSRRTANDAPSRFVRHLQSGYVKFQLGGNLKSMIKQFGSAVNMLSVADFDVWFKGLNPETVLSKGARADMIKYSTVAGNRVDSNEIYYASGAVGSVDKISDALMKHLEWGDTGANLILWSMAQHAIAKETNHAIGTEENKRLAGKRLDDYIMKVQDTSGAASKSAYARSPQVLVQGMTLFTSSPTKMFSRLLVSTSEYFELKRMQRDGGFSAAEQERLGKLEKDALKTAGKVGGAILAAAVFESVINLLWGALRSDDDEEDEKKVQKVAMEVVSNVVGIVPLAGTAAESLLSGYDVSNLYLDIYNDGLGALRNTYTMTANLAAGKQVSQRDIIKNLRSVAYFTGQVTGIPVRNINTMITMTLNTFAPSAAYEYDQLFYEPAYAADLKKAVESGNERLVSSIVDLTLKERTGAASSYAADEVVRLAMAGHSVMPKAVPQSITVDGEEVALTRKQQAAFKDIYSEADSAVIGLMATEQFAELSDELRAKAIKVAYEIYHSRAKSEVLGGELSVMAALSYLDEYIDVPTLVAESAYVYGIKSTPEATRSELVRQYLAGYSPQAQAILLYAAGYRSEGIKQELSGIVASLEEDTQNRVKTKLDF